MVINWKENYRQPANLVEVVTKEEFIVVVEQLRLCQQELEFIRSLLLNQRWLNRQQTMEALDLSESTRWQLTKANALTYRKQSPRFFTMYSVYGLS